MKKLFFAAFALVLTVPVLILTGCYTTSFSGSSSNLNHNESNGVWTITAASVNGRLTRTFNITQAGLDMFMVSSFNTQGEVELVITQGDTRKALDITSGFLVPQRVDLDEFEAGRISVRLNFTSARAVATVVSWRV
ncbi:MAG: hypothetical protein FWE31_00480 [Firmicutes bacterium]|nr:hypothetical protein [Bacillota bacterium]